MSVARPRSTACVTKATAAALNEGSRHARTSGGILSGVASPRMATISCTLAPESREGATPVSSGIAAEEEGRSPRRETVRLFNLKGARAYLSRRAEEGFLRRRVRATATLEDAAISCGQRARPFAPTKNPTRNSRKQAHPERPNRETEHAPRAIAGVRLFTGRRQNTNISDGENANVYKARPRGGNTNLTVSRGAGRGVGTIPNDVELSRVRGLIEVRIMAKRRLAAVLSDAVPAYAGRQTRVPVSIMGDRGEAIICASRHEIINLVSREGRLNILGWRRPRYCSFRFSYPFDSHMYSSLWNRATKEDS